MERVGGGCWTCDVILEGGGSLLHGTSPVTTMLAGIFCLICVDAIVLRPASLIMTVFFLI